MRCVKCDSQWSIGNSDVQYLSCPLCGENFQINSHLRRYDSIIELLYVLLEEHGSVICKNERMINGYLNDLFPQAVRERDAIKRLLEQGLGEVIYSYLTGECDTSDFQEKVREYNSEIMPDVLMDGIDFLCKLQTVRGTIYDKEYFLSIFKLTEDVKYKLEALERALLCDPLDNGLKHRIAEFKLLHDDSEEGVEKLKELAEQGEKDALLHLAILYLKGVRVPQNIQQAVTYFESAANLGSVEAHYELGCLFADDTNACFDSGRAEGYLRNINGPLKMKANYLLYKILYQIAERKHEAIQYLEEAAKMMCVPAMYDYAIHLLYGDDVKEDSKLAVEYLQKCADVNDRSAISKLKYIYQVGYKVTKDANLAGKYEQMLKGE